MSNRMRSMIVSAISLLCATTIGADTIYGPKIYRLETGKPQVFHDRFAVDTAAMCDGKSAFILVVRNGDENGANAVSSAEITVNGVRMLSERDFRPGHPGPLERSFLALPNNSLDVTLTGGQPGSSIGILVKREIEESLFPSLDLSLTKNGDHPFSHPFAAPQLPGDYTLVIQNGDDDGDRRVNHAQIRLNGTTIIGQAEVTTDTFLLRRPITLQPNNLLEFDVAGNIHDLLRVSVKRRLDERACSALRIAIESPAAAASIQGSRSLVGGRVTGTMDVGVAVNGYRADVDLNHAGSSADPYRWWADVSVAPGNRTLVATATSGAGASAADSRSIIVHASDAETFLRASTQSGIAPLKVDYSVVPPDSSNIVRYDFDLDGDGTFELSGPTIDTALTFTYARAGVYVCERRAALRQCPSRKP